jgi:Mg2+-importing ATPase
MVAGMSFLSPISERHRPRNETEARDGTLAEICRLQPAEACIKLRSGPGGLSRDDAKARLKKFGPNLVARQRKPTIPEELWNRARNPLNALLLTLAVASYFLGDLRAAVVIATMVVLAIATAFIQEHQSDEAAARLRAMVHTTTSVRRRPGHSEDAFFEIPIDQLVPGDVVRLSAGDMIPADMRLLEAKDLFVNQAALTGESMPAEEHAQASISNCKDALDLPNICFMGANVVSGYPSSKSVGGHGLGLFLALGALASAWVRARLGDRVTGMTELRQAAA